MKKIIYLPLNEAIDLLIKKEGKHPTAWRAKRELKKNPCLLIEERVALQRIAYKGDSAYVDTFHGSELFAVVVCNRK